MVSERILKEGLEFTDNRFVVEGNYKYTYNNNGHLAMADPLAAARNFLNAMERIPSIIDQYKAKNEVLYYLFVKQYSTTRLAAIRGQSDRNIRKLRMTIQKKLQRRMYEHLSEKLENGHGITLREREFMEEYEALLQTMGKDAVIRR